MSGIPVKSSALVRNGWGSIAYNYMYVRSALPSGVIEPTTLDLGLVSDIIVGLTENRRRRMKEEDETENKTDITAGDSNDRLPYDLW